MPTVAEIQAQQQALKVAEAENAMPHIEAALVALAKKDVQALAALCAEAVPQVADQQVQKAIGSIANIINLSNGVLTRLREQAQAVLPLAEAQTASES